MTKVRFICKKWHYQSLKYDSPIINMMNELLFYLVSVSHYTLKYFTYTKAARIMAGNV